MEIIKKVKMNEEELFIAEEFANMLWETPMEVMDEVNEHLECHLPDLIDEFIRWAKE